MARSRPLPKWLVVLLVIAAAVVLGPPALGFLFAALGLAVGLGALLLKLGFVAVGVYAIYLVANALFGKPTAAGATEQRRSDSLANNVDQLDRLDAERRALDQELERAIAATRK